MMGGPHGAASCGCAHDRSMVPPNVNAGTSTSQTMSELFEGMESITCRETSRHGLRNLSKQQMHDKLLHSGDVGECSICMTLRRGRSLQGYASRVMDPIHVVGRQWPMDAITWSNRGKDGEKLTVGAIDESSIPVGVSSGGFSSSAASRLFPATHILFVFKCRVS